MDALTIQKAKKLASEMLRIENNIQNVLANNNLNFDICYDNEEGWIVQTSYCQMGGCVMDSIPCKSEQEALFTAAKLTYFGDKPTTSGLCSSCRKDWYEMQL